MSLEEKLKEESQEQLDSQSGETNPEDKSGQETPPAKAKTWLNSVPEKYRSRIEAKYDSMAEIFEAALGEEVEKKDVTTPEQKPKKKTLEEELKGLWGEDYTSNLEKAKSGIVAVKQKNPELVKRILSQEAGLSADIVDILATVAQDNPAFVDSSKTKPSSSDGQDFKGIRNRFSIQGL